MVEEEKGLSIKDIFKIIFKRLWWVVSVTAAALILLACLVQFWYNPSRQQYTVSFDIRLPSYKENSDGTVSEQYPDGTVLRLEDAILLKNLRLIKDESLLPEDLRTGKFADIDIEKMVKEDDIVLTRTIKENEDGTYDYHSTLRITKKYFKSNEQAISFIGAVAEFPVINAKYIVNTMNYSNQLEKFKVYNTYEEKIDALIKQKEFIEQSYEDLKTLYSGEYVPAGLNMDIDEYIRSMTNVFDAREQEAVSNIVLARYYVYDTATYLENAQAKIGAFEIEKKNNENRIKALRDERDQLKSVEGIQDIEIDAFNQRIVDLTDKNAVIDNEIAEVEETKARILKYTEGSDKAEKDEFDRRLDKIRADLEAATQTLKTVNVATYEEKAQAIYVNNKVEVTGGLNIILAAVIGAVVGFFVVSIVILIIDTPKYKRAKLAAEDEKSGGQPDGVSEDKE